MKIVGLDEEKIKAISHAKQEDKSILEFRINCYKKFKEQELPSFGPKIEIDFDKIVYYKNDNIDLTNNWENITEGVKDEFKDLGVISSEKNMDGIGVQYESEVIYHHMLKELEEKNIIFTSIEDAFKKYPELVKKYFAKIVGPTENKLTSLNGAVFSGGSFIYIPKNTKLDRPLQSYFRIDSKDLGQFERTLIVVDDNSELHYIEGCTARRNFAIVTILAYAGLRISECLNLRKADICLKSNQLKVVSGKGEKARIVIVNTKIISAVREYQKTDHVESEWLFHNSRGEMLNQTTINRVFKLYCPKGYDITPHTLRHFYAINAVSSGIFTIPEIANQMGHSSIKTTMRYMNPNLEEIRQKVEML